jgi:hypothetical protein
MLRAHHLFKISLASALLLAIPAPSFAGVFVGVGIGVGGGFGIGVSVNTAPPALPAYVQPPCLTEGYIWTPGYWAWGPAGYFWVPGTWIAPPAVGVLWTPGYWGWGGGNYAWHPGYWGPHIGFYGGVNYGFGYFGAGYVGGRWAGNVFRYNTAVTNVNPTVIRNVYLNKTVVINNYNNYNNSTIDRVSYNGGARGIVATPTVEQRTAAQERRFGLSSAQQQHINFAAHNRNLLATVNAGHPAQLAVDRPYSAANRPVDAAPLQAEDRRNASSAVVKNAAAFKPRQEMLPAGRQAAEAPSGQRENPQSNAWNRFEAQRGSDPTASARSGVDAAQRHSYNDAAVRDARPTYKRPAGAHYSQSTPDSHAHEPHAASYARPSRSGKPHAADAAHPEHRKD